MSEAAFNQLVHATSIQEASTLYFLLVIDWAEKRKGLLLQLADIVQLDSEHKSRRETPYGSDERLSVVDATPTLRLANAVEATANGLYSMAEIAASFANRVSGGRFPASFNALRKKMEQDESSESAKAVGSLQWYKKIREMRTEWTHHSSTFIAKADNGDTLICLRSNRRRTDRVEFPEKSFLCTIEEFSGWVRSAIGTLDTFAGYLLNAYVISKFNPEATFLSVVKDARGMPKLRTDGIGLFETETITVRQYFARAGIKI